MDRLLLSQTYRATTKIAIDMIATPISNTL
jgi:hypothetical protein